MASFHKSYWLKQGESRPAQGCRFVLIHAGSLRVDKEITYSLGNYNCWHIVTDGQGFLRCGELYFELHKGDLFSVMYNSHIEYGPLPGKEFEFCYLRVEGEECDAMTRSLGLTPCYPVRFHTGEKTIALFRDVWALAAKDCPVQEAYASGILKILSHLISMGTPVASGGRDHAALVEEAVQLLNDPMDLNYNVNELCEALHVSRVTLFHAFKEVKGCSPSSFIQNLRYQKILTLLSEDPLQNLSDIARKTHFPDVKYLIRFFRKYASLTPGQYRKKLQRSHRE